MATKVTIVFEVPDDKYNEYEEVYTDFDSSLSYIGITKIDVTEIDTETSNKV